MAISAEMLAGIRDHPWTDVAKAAKEAMVTSLLGGVTLAINGRAIGRVTPKDAKEIYLLATDMIAIESAGEQGGGNVLVNFNR